VHICLFRQSDSGFYSDISFIASKHVWQSAQRQSMVNEVNTCCLSRLLCVITVLFFWSLYNPALTG
jgi:hypothetical protein